jgi:hypothetical protein
LEPMGSPRCKEELQPQLFLYAPMCPNDRGTSPRHPRPLG